MYTIKRAAEMVGVSEATLRAWERRYGIGATHRTESGYRLYDEATVGSLTTMHRLIESGWAVRAAADEVLHQASRPGQPTPEPQASGVLERDTAEFIRAAIDLDPHTLDIVLDRRFAATTFESVADDWLLPTLVALGQAWERGEVTVAGEHLVAGGVQRRLAAVYEAAGENALGPRILVGLPAKSRHELGLLAFATAARRHGLSTTWLGADVPLKDWSTAVEAIGPTAVVLTASMDSDLAALEATVAQLRAQDPGLLIAVGGAAQDLAPPECVRLGHSVGPAVVRLTDLLTSPARARARASR
ncbi:MerR family transcriptional regulator [Nocardioides sp. GXZ039]|uniref:MerR family transcriptional regulator n=1 Tax=Nocardioides sp. GXZ039 TaxID=3136018 RepID=UPI0030F3BF18